jgi:hypothetical protein
MPRGLNPYDEAQLQRRLWTPDLLRPALWLDAADRSTITIATGVSQWRDKSGNERNATQSTAANQPAYTIGGLNGRNILTFDGTNDHLLHSFNASPAPHSVFAVARRTSGGGGSGYQVLFEAIGLNSAFGVNISAKAFNLTNWGEYINSWIDSGQSLLNNWSAVAMISPTATSGTETLDTNGRTTTVAYTARYPGDAFARQAIGADPGFGLGDGVLKGDIAEIVVFMSALSKSGRDLMIGYLAWKWGLVSKLLASHPFCNRPPLIGD